MSNQIVDVKLNGTIVGMACTPEAKGYWLVASDGSVYCFGNAEFYGSMNGKHLSKPVTGILATPTGLGYWLYAADGGIFAYGDAPFHGTTHPV